MQIYRPDHNFQDQTAMLNYSHKNKVCVSRKSKLKKHQILFLTVYIAAL